jgi:hypothetical protein
MLRCRLLGHRFRFAADGDTMHWRCERGCGAGGEKRYATAAEAGVTLAPSTVRTAPTSAAARRSACCPCGSPVRCGAAAGANAEPTAQRGWRVGRGFIATGSRPAGIGLNLAGGPLEPGSSTGRVGPPS